MAPKPPLPDANQKLLSDFSSGGAYLMVLQLFSRLATFFLNTLLLRFTTPDIFGIANIQMELLSATLLFLSREGIRCSIMRIDNLIDTKLNSSETKMQLMVNMSYIPVVLGALWTFGVIIYQLMSIYISKLPWTWMGISVLFYCVAAWIELMSEPFFILAQYRLQFKTRLRVEGTALFAKCLTTLCLSVMIYNKSWSFLHDHSSDIQQSNNVGVLAFAIAQVVYGIALLCGYVSNAYQRKESDFSLFFPKRVIIIESAKGKHKAFFYGEICKLAWTLTQQSVLKHLLTKGDDILLTAFSTPYEQGIYALVANYGSLVARIFFQPLEETCRLLFSKVGEEKKTEYDLSQQLQPVIELFQFLLKAHVMVGLFFICLGTNYTTALLALLAGSRWSLTQAPNVLAWYCCFIPWLGINGLCEALVHSIAPENALRSLNRWLLLFSTIYLLIGVYLMHVVGLGCVGLIWANMLNFAMRIAWCWRFSVHYFEKANLILSCRSLLPHPRIAVIFIVSWIVTRFSFYYCSGTGYFDLLIHIGIGGIFGIVLLASIYLLENSFMIEFKNLFNNSKEKIS